MKRRVRFKAGGRVQGVAFRAGAYERALDLGLAGWVRNRLDGDVEGVAEGEASAVDSFLAWCRQGPAGARVDRLEIGDETALGDLSRFEIRR